MSAETRSVPVLSSPIDALVRPPGSKSETIRALAAASMADGRSHLYQPLRATDTDAMIGSLRRMGVRVADETEPWSVDGAGGHLETGVTVDARESGLTARILIAMAGSASGETRIVGTGRLPQRPMGGIIDALRAQGVEVSKDRIPLDVIGRGPLWGGHILVDCSQSSQFATALMLVAPLMEKPCTLEPAGLAGSEGYLDGTVSVMRRFGAGVVRTVTGFEIDNDGYQPADTVVEPDASAATYPMAIAAITGGRVIIEGLGQDSWQPDIYMAVVLEQMGCRVGWEESNVTIDARGVRLKGVNVDMSRAPDGALALAVACLFAETSSRISGLASLRHKESDRLAAITDEMRRIGGDVEVVDDTLVVRPVELTGATIDPHGDHRIAMALACAGSRVEGVSVSSPHVVDKTWPGFWDFLESLPS